MNGTFDRFTERAKGFIQSAQYSASSANHQQLTPEHLLQNFMEDREGLATRLLTASGGNTKEIYQRVKTELKRLPSVEGSGAGQVYLSSGFSKILTQAEQLADKAGDSYVTVEYLLLSLSMVPDTASFKILTSSGVNSINLNKSIKGNNVCH